MALMIKNPPAILGDMRDAGSIPRWGRSPEEGMATHSSIFFPGESHGQRSLVASVHRVTKSHMLKNPMENSCRTHTIKRPVSLIKLL